MDKKKLDELASELAKDIKTEADLNELTRILVKTTVEKALNAELEEHLGYSKNSPEGRGSGNNRNGNKGTEIRGQEIRGHVPI